MPTMPRGQPAITKGSSLSPSHYLRLLFRAGSLLLILGVLLSLPAQLQPSAQAAGRNPARSDLICHTQWDTILPVTHHLVQSADPFSIDIGISGRYGGVGVEFWLGSEPFSASSVINILEARSSAGAGWQFSSFTTAYDGPQFIVNQASGNSRGYQWGFSTVYNTNKTYTLNATNWAPNYTDRFDLFGTSPCELYDSVSNPTLMFDEGKMKLLALRRWTPDGFAIAITNAYSLRSTVDQYWRDYLPAHAFYLNRGVAREHNLRLYLVGPTWSEGPILPYQTGLTVQHAWLGYDTANNPSWVIDASASYAVFVWQIGDLDAGVAIPLVNGANMSLEETVYCDDPLNDACGSIRWLTLQHMTLNAAFPLGSIRTYEFSYFVGTPQQLAYLGFPLP